MDIRDYSTTAANNTDDFPENMAPSAVNDGARKVQADLAKLIADDGGTLTLGGTATAQTLTLNTAPTALSDGLFFSATCATANTGATTLTVTPAGGSAFAAKKVLLNGGAALGGGEMISGGHYLFQYDSAADGGAGAFILLTPTSIWADVGQCLLAKSGANLVLSPRNGNKLTINGAVQTVPSAGVSLAATGLTAGTLYYIYAYMSAGTMTLEASTTGYATDATTGVTIKSGDATRTLVGMARPITGPAWQDTAAQRFVRSWFNDPGVTTRGALTASRSTTNTTYEEIGSELRNEVLLWEGESWSLHLSGASNNSTTAQATYTQIGIDGVSEPPVALHNQQTALHWVPCPVSVTKVGLTEGYHFACLRGRVSGGTGNWYWIGATETTALHGATRR